MSSWECPVEAYISGWDWQIRDAKRRTILKIDPSNLDYQKQELTKKNIKCIVELMNAETAVQDYFKTLPGDLSSTRNEFVNTQRKNLQEFLAPTPSASQSNGNGHLSELKPKKRGNPNWIKGMKRK